MTDRAAINFLERWDFPSYLGEQSFVLSDKVSRVISQWVEDFPTLSKKFGITFLEGNSTTGVFPQVVAYEVCFRILLDEKIMKYIRQVNLSEFLLRFGLSFEEQQEKLIKVREGIKESDLIVLSSLGVAKCDDVQKNLLNLVLNDILSNKRPFLVTLSCSEDEIEDFIGHANLSLIQLCSLMVKV